MSKPITTAPTVEALTQQLRAEGFSPGAPRHVTAQSQAIDAHACRRLRCPACRQRGCAYRPFHNSRCSYRVLACCQHCPAAQEM
jgi:hypothetical protein